MDDKKAKVDKDSIEKKIEEEQRRENEQLFEDIFGLSIQDAVKEEVEIDVDKVDKSELVLKRPLRIPKKPRGVPEPQAKPVPEQELKAAAPKPVTPMKTPEPSAIQAKQLEPQIDQAMKSMPKPGAIPPLQEKISPERPIEESTPAQQTVPQEQQDIGDSPSQEDVKSPFADKGVLEVVSVQLDSEKQKETSPTPAPQVIRPKPVMTVTAEGGQEGEATGPSDKHCPFCGEKLTREMEEGIEMGFIIECNECGKRIMNL